MPDVLRSIEELERDRQEHLSVGGEITGEIALGTAFVDALPAHLGEGRGQFTEGRIATEGFEITCDHGQR